MAPTNFAYRVPQVLITEMETREPNLTLNPIRSPERRLMLIQRNDDTPQKHADPIMIFHAAPDFLPAVDCVRHDASLSIVPYRQRRPSRAAGMSVDPIA